MRRSRIFNIANSEDEAGFPAVQNVRERCGVEQDKTCEDLERECEKYERAIASLDFSKGDPGRPQQRKNEEGERNKSD